MLTKEQLRLKLAEVAEFRMPKISNTDIKEAKSRARGRKSNEEKYQEEHEEVFMDLFNGINPTHSPELVKVHIKPVDCEDCGKHLEEGRVMEIKYYAEHSKHIAHRRDRCKSCNKYRDPYTGLFTLPQGPACQTYLNWAKAEYSARNKQAKKDLDK